MMFIRMLDKILVPLTCFITGMMVGIATALWDKVEVQTIFLYTGLVVLFLIAVGIFGFELWRAARSYRRAVGKQLETPLERAVPSIHITSPPKVRVIEHNPDAMDFVEGLFAEANRKFGLQKGVIGNDQGTKD